jgi:hypothetical protein
MKLTEKSAKVKISLMYSHSQYSETRCFIAIAFNSALEHAILKVQQNEERNDMNGTHQLLVYADDVNILGDNINTAKKNKEALLKSSRWDGLVVNTEKAKYMVMFRHV